MPDLATYEAIQSQVADGSQSTFTFSNIPQTYTDLVCVWYMRQISNAATNNQMRYNGDTGSNYSNFRLGGSSGAVFQGGGFNGTSMYIDSFDAANFGVTIVQIHNYTNTAIRKTQQVRSSHPSASVEFSQGAYNSTNAITSITVFNPSYNFASGSTFTIYGIKSN